MVQFSSIIPFWKPPVIIFLQKMAQKSYFFRKWPKKTYFFRDLRGCASPEIDFWSPLSLYHIPNWNYAKRYPNFFAFYFQKPPPGGLLVQKNTTGGSHSDGEMCTWGSSKKSKSITFQTGIMPQNPKFLAV